jgi:amidase
MDIEKLLREGSARQIGAQIAQRRLGAADAAQWYLARIEAYNRGGAALNAVRTVSPRALEDAAAADAEIAAGRIKGPLHGVPFLVKDNILTGDGMPASAGARALEGFVPRYAATLVERLRAAGAVLLGKTQMTEFADFVSDLMPAAFSGVGGVVRNPLGTRYDRGQGSSVGSAAATAARFAAFAIGTETQNSIQTPASHSSIVGFKPSVGAVSRWGVMPLVPSQDSPGPMTVCVEDAALVFAAIAGPDVRDTATLAHLPRRAGAATALRGLRIGVPRRHFADKAAGAQARAFDDALQALSHAGAVIVDPCELPRAPELEAVRSSVFRTEFKAALDAFLADHGAPCGIASMAALIAWNEAHPEAIPYGQSLLAAADQTTGLADAAYLEDRRRDIALSLDDGILRAMQEARVDALLCPMSVAAKCTGKAGAPVIAVPAGADAEGQAFGVTLFAGPGEDLALLAIAALVEQAIGRRVLPPF